MQPDGTYQLIETLGSCQVGTVWSAVDAQGRSLTVAVLDAAVASDQRWRDAFAATADALLRAEPGGPRFLYADYAASAPWVACAAGDGPGAERVFQDLGLDYHPASSSGPAAGMEATTAGTGVAPTRTEERPSQPDTPSPPANESSFLRWPTVGLQPVSNPPPPVSSPPQPFSASPPPVSAPPAPISGGPQPVSGVPQSPAVGPLPPVGDIPQWPPRPLSPVGDIPQSSPYDPGYPPLLPSEPDEPRRRTGLWIAVAIVLLLALAVSSGVYAWRQSGGKPTAAASSSPQPVSLPTGAPLSPGVEPPRADGWPVQWPKFLPTDPVRTYSALKGLGFPLKVPSDWECLLGASADGYVKYNCGVSPGDKPAIGGEVIVRDCPQPCDAVQQQTMRQAEEAWGAQWHQAGPYAVWGENLPLVDGAQRHALLVIAYFRGGSSDQIDRQLVLRLIGPIDQAYQLRRVANYLRDTLVF